MTPTSEGCVKVKRDNICRIAQCQAFIKKKKKVDSTPNVVYSPHLMCKGEYFQNLELRTKQSFVAVISVL